MYKSREVKFQQKYLTALEIDTFEAIFHALCSQPIEPLESRCEIVRSAQVAEYLQILPVYSNAVQGALVRSGFLLKDPYMSSVELLEAACKL